jgi:hypothetical protein
VEEGEEGYDSRSYFIGEIAAQNDANHLRTVTAGRRGKQPVHLGTRPHAQGWGDRDMRPLHGQIMRRRREENRAARQRCAIGRERSGKVPLTGEDGGQARREELREMLGIQITVPNCLSDSLTTLRRASMPSAELPMTTRKRRGERFCPPVPSFIGR